MGRPRPSETTATITFTYESAYNQIVEPTHYVSLSQYFIAHWMPQITPNGLKILLQLRAMGYYNPKAGVSRGDIDIEQKELAALCGMSHSTLKRAFTDDLVLSQYVQRVFHVKREPRTGRIIKEHYVYAVKMDDVLTPSDKSRLEELLQGPEKGQKASENSPTAQNEPSDPAPRAQNDPSAGQNDPPRAQNEPWTGQNDPSLNRSLITLNNLNTPNTAALPGGLPAATKSPEKAPGNVPPSRRRQNSTVILDRPADASLTLLGTILQAVGPKTKTAQTPEPETASTPLPLLLPSWESLGEAQQRLYLQQAERELIELYTETKTQTHTGKPSRRIILSRARSLSQKQRQNQSQTHEP